MSITNFVQKIKDFLESEKGRLACFICIVILTGISSFLLGKISTSLRDKDTACVSIANSPVELYSTSKTKNTDLSTISASGQASAIKSLDLVSQKSGSYVASKRGKRFYPVDCSAGSSIVGKNKVYFSTREEAIKKGYTASPSCE